MHLQRLIVSKYANPLSLICVFIQLWAGMIAAYRKTEMFEMNIKKQTKFLSKNKKIRTRKNWNDFKCQTHNGSLCRRMIIQVEIQKELFQVFTKGEAEFFRDYCQILSVTY